jgi:hypothetical protein
MKNLTTLVGVWLFCFAVVLGASFMIFNYSVNVLSFDYIFHLLATVTVLTAAIYFSIGLVKFAEWYDEQDGLFKFKQLPTADDLSFKYDI